MNRKHSYKKNKFNNNNDEDDTTKDDNININQNEINSIVHVN